MPDVSRFFDISADLLALLDASGHFVLANPSWQRVFGWDPATLVGKSVLEVVHPDDRRGARGLARFSDQPLSFQTRVVTDDGSWRWLEWNITSSGEHRYAIARDITERKQRELRAATDPLTGLANRAAGIELLGDFLRTLRDSPGLIGVLFIDVDHLKLINDGRGYEVGDGFLKLAARRAGEVASMARTIARFGGDEFIIVITDLRSSEELLAEAERIVEAFEHPLLLEGQLHRTTVSVGASISSDPEKQADALIHEADIAMYRAKARGGSCARLFDENVRLEVTRRVDDERDLRRAIELGQLVVHYQPIVSLPEMSVSRCEALLRWQHPTRGLVAPQEFVPLAEETGLIVELGTWVLDHACQQAAAWRREGWDLGITVNVSTRQLEQPLFVDVVRSVLTQTSLPAAALCLEITETGTMRDPAAVAPSLEELSRTGVQIAMDDFGSGQSSLSHLDLLPLDMIKIDRSFVAGIPDSAESRAIVAALLSLARETKIVVVAEGVENDVLNSELIELGCELAQGFLYDRPRPADELRLDGYSSRVRQRG
jgi:diguanylate cyclase (GGDEF)-like protein/PAS domain S-box-containing protein